MVCIIVTDLKKNVFKGLAEHLCNRFSDIVSIVLNENSKNTNVILGNKFSVLYGKETIYDVMCGNIVEISPQSFYQVNTIQAEKLYGLAAEYAQLKCDDILLDLYCGAGTIGLSMASRVKKIIGVEIIDSAIRNAAQNAKKNGILNSEFICGDAGRIAEVLYNRGERPDIIIVDPARKGCDKTTLEYMAKMNP